MPRINVTPDVLDPVVAAANRAAIEAALRGGRRVPLPAGTIHLDRAITLTPDHSHATLHGTGCCETTLRNSFATTPYGTNCTLMADGASTWQGYADTVANVSGMQIALAPGTDLAPYQAGRVVYLFDYDWYTQPGGQPPVRRQILSASGNVVTLNSPAPPRNRAKWLDGVPAYSVVEGDRRVAPLVPLDLGRFAVGMTVYVCDGPAIANANRGYFANVQKLVGNAIGLDRDAPFTMTCPTICPARPVLGLTLADLTLAVPANTQSNPGFLAGAVDVALDSVQVGQKGEDALELAFVGCDRVTIVNAGPVRPSPFAFNTTTRVLVSGGRVSRIGGEEGGDDWRIRSLVLGDAGGTLALRAAFGCSRVNLDGVTIKATGGNFATPVLITGDRYTFLDVVMRDTPAGMQGWNLQGSHGRLERVASDIAIGLAAGKGLAVVDSPGLALVVSPGVTGTTSGQRPGGAPATWPDTDAAALPRTTPDPPALPKNA